MITVLYVLLIITCIVLIISVLLQPGKADAGALFSSAISSTAFGPRGTQTLLAKITIGAAAVFMLIAIAISLSGSRQQSALRGEAGEQQQATPTPTATPPQPPAEQSGANTATDNTGAPIETKAPTSPATGNDTGSATQPQPSPSQ